MTVSLHPPYSSPGRLCGSFPKSKWPQEVNIKYTEAATTASLKTLRKEDSRAVAESGKNLGINSKHGRRVEGIYGDVSLPVTHSTGHAPGFGIIPRMDHRVAGAEHRCCNGALHHWTKALQHLLCPGPGTEAAPWVRLVGGGGGMSGAFLSPDTCCGSPLPSPAVQGRPAIRRITSYFW